jgi:2-polyprenyl-3-methyl-5-hydroxy-6-metoxy-1,4-benzoquinol methylase
MECCPVCSCRKWELFTTTFDRLLNRPEPVWEIRRCQSCGFGWTDPPLAEDEIIHHYPPTYLGHTAQTIEDFLTGKLQRSRSWRRETEKVALLERFVSGGRILDVGCGDGKFLWALDPGKWDRTGVELADETVRLVRSRISDITLVEGNIFSQELPRGSFDVITFWHVLEHLPQPLKVLERASQLLRSKGWFLISLPNFNSLQAHLFGRHWYAFDDVPRHLYHYAPLPLEMLLQKAGLRVHKHIFFSLMANMHCLKYSLINWSNSHFGSRLPYYLLKPFLLAFPLVERCNGRHGMLTTIGTKEITNVENG